MVLHDSLQIPAGLDRNRHFWLGRFRFGSFEWSSLRVRGLATETPELVPVRTGMQRGNRRTYGSYDCGHFQRPPAGTNALDSIGGFGGRLQLFPQRNREKSKEELSFALGSTQRWLADFVRLIPMNDAKTTELPP